MWTVEEVYEGKVRKFFYTTKEEAIFKMVCIAEHNDTNEPTAVVLRHEVSPRKDNSAHLV